MRLYELLAVILGFYGGLYQDWLEEFGEERLSYLLNRLRIEPDASNLDFYRFALSQSLIEELPEADLSSYQYLEDLVESLKLPEEIEDSVWENPHYRTYIESPLPIEKYVVDKQLNRVNVFYYELVFEGQRLLRAIEFNDLEFKLATESIKRQFLRARTHLLDLAGIPRLESVRSSGHLRQSFS